MEKIASEMDEDTEIYDEETGMFRGQFLDHLVDEVSAMKHFGPDYRLSLISVPDMQAFIRPRFIAPARPLDIDFLPFSIYPEHLIYNSICNEILEDIGNLSQRFEWFSEVDVGVTEEWLCTQIDEEIALRHIPLLPTHTGSIYFHAYHLDSFLRFAFRLKDGHQIFGKKYRSSGPALWHEYNF